MQLCACVCVVFLSFFFLPCDSTLVIWRHAYCIPWAYDSIRQSAIEIVKQFSYILQIISEIACYKIHIFFLFLAKSRQRRQFQYNEQLQVCVCAHILIITQSKHLLAAHHKICEQDFIDDVVFIAIVEALFNSMCSLSIYSNYTCSEKGTIESKQDQLIWWCFV